MAAALFTKADMALQDAEKSTGKRIFSINASMPPMTPVTLFLRAKQKERAAGRCRRMPA
jgi:hypothetical protein